MSVQLVSLQSFGPFYASGSTWKSLCGLEGRYKNACCNYGKIRSYFVFFLSRLYHAVWVDLENPWLQKWNSKKEAVMNKSNIYNSTQEEHWVVLVGILPSMYEYRSENWLHNPTCWSQQTESCGGFGHFIGGQAESCRKLLYPTQRCRNPTCETILEGGRGRTSKHPCPPPKKRDFM